MERDKTFGLGYIPSPADSRDVILDLKLDAIPDEYDIHDLGNITDQGQDPICAAVCLSDILNWTRGIKGVKGHISAYDVYGLRADKKQQGMVLRDALKVLRKEGVDGDKIKGYARITDPVSAKAAITMNGPVVAGFYCYDYGDRFWAGSGKNLGGHAVLLTGWDGDGFVLRNSWGTGWGRSGTSVFPLEDWCYLLECWSILL